MDVKAELVLLIFTLNCVTLILTGKDLIRSRLCRDKYGHDPACILTLRNTPIILNDTTSTIAHMKNITNTSLSNGISLALPLPLQRSPHLQPQQQPRQLLSSLASKGEKEEVDDSHDLLSLLPPLKPKINKNHLVNVTQAVESCGLILTATFLSTSVVSSQVLGRWIDRWSRKSMMMLPLTGVVLWATCGVMVSAAPWNPIFLWFVGAGLCGLCGGFITLKTAVTTYALQAMERGDKIVKLALLQAAISIGVFVAYLCSYYLPANTHGEISNTLLGITLMGILDIIFAAGFLSTTSRTPPPLSPTTPSTTPRTRSASNPPPAGPATRVNAHNSTVSLARHAQREEEMREEEEEQRERRYAGKNKIIIVDVVKEDDKCDEDEKEDERHAQRDKQEEMEVVVVAEQEEEKEERNDGYHEERMVEAVKEEDDKCDESEDKERKEGERYVNHEDDECAENEKEERIKEKKVVGECDRNEENNMEEEKNEDEYYEKEEKQKKEKDEKDEWLKNGEREEKEDEMNAIKDTENIPAHPVFPIDIFVISPIEEQDENLSDVNKNTEGNTAIESGEIDRDEGHLIAYSTEEEGMNTKQIRLAFHGSSPSHHTITIASEDGSSVYGTPPEPSSHYGTPPSRTLSRHSMEAAAAAAEGVHQQAVSAFHHPPQACVPCCCHHRVQDYRCPINYGIGLSSSLPSTLPSTINFGGHETPHIFQNEMQFKHRLGGCSSQHDSLMSQNVLLTPDSSDCSSLSCEGSHPNCNSSSDGCQHCHDVLREDEGYNFGAYASLDDVQSLSLSVSSNSDALSLSNNPSSTTRQPEISPPTQNESIGEVSEGAGGRSSAPLTLASESSGEGECCAGGAGRCRVCVAGGLLCRPVSVTFRRRAAGLRGIVVADVVATFLISMVAAVVCTLSLAFICSRVGGYATLPGSKDEVVPSRLDPVSSLPQRTGSGGAGGGTASAAPMVGAAGHHTGVLGGVSSIASSTFLSFVTSSSTAIPLTLTFGPLAQYLNVSSVSILVRLVDMSELGGAIMCLCTIEQLGLTTGLLTSHYIFPLLLRCKMPGVTFITTGLLVTVPSVILGGYVHVELLAASHRLSGLGVNKAQVSRDHTIHLNLVKIKHAL
ncbi:uncharacterized protein LOC123498491 isoform X3 [Portunus trituberculatus]|uniref:uncharacterized protein LOC123498491 isoform X3 n=1 Tax=Portunus trituberculatus TaxID=210409 RepID=UPI001E1CC0E9|nr:uncharacterized protein LOC123498491 isoform X3 [Portunus trituberculatus]